MIVKSQKGDTLVEVTIAVAILSMVLMTCYVLANRAFQLSQAAKERRQATELMQQQVEYVYSLRDNSTSWADFKTKIAACNPAGTVCHFRLNPTNVLSANAGQLTNGNYRIRLSYADAVIADNTNCSGCALSDKLVFSVHAEWVSAFGGPLSTADMEFFLVNNYTTATP